MTKIPQDHRAARELYDAFVQLGRERAEESPAARRPRRRNRRRALLVLVLAVLVPAAAAGAAHLLLDGGSAVPHEPKLPPDVRRAPADRALAAATATDPDRALPWGLRLYASAAGGRCALVGRVRTGALGVVRDGRFRAFTPDAPGMCAQPGQRTLVATQASGTGPARRSVLFGFVDRSVTEVRIVDGNRSKTVTIAPDGSYIFVSAAPFSGTLVLASKDGETRRDLAP